MVRYFNLVDHDKFIAVGRPAWMNLITCITHSSLSARLYFEVTEQQCRCVIPIRNHINDTARILLTYWTTCFGPDLSICVYW